MPSDVDRFLRTVAKSGLYPRDQLADLVRAAPAPGRWTVPLFALYGLYIAFTDGVGKALISDLAVYYPDRRKEGLAQGTLKQLFQEEIQKSWEEFTEQVGKELAESTTYFNDALNEILAGGQKVF